MALANSLASMSEESLDYKIKTKVAVYQEVYLAPKMNKEIMSELSNL